MALNKTSLKRADEDLPGNAPKRPTADDSSSSGSDSSSDDGNSSSSNGGSKGSRNDNNRLPNQIVHIKRGQNHISFLTASRSAEETAKLAQKVATRQLQHAQGHKKELAALHKKVRDGAAALAKTEKRATKDIKVWKETYEQEKKAKENLRAELREARVEKNRAQRAAANAIRLLQQGQEQQQDQEQEQEQEQDQDW
ncbi:hypothetical protein CF319_g8988 [Tilletia indica]|nr:hypothetical protein CF319_g8988 [Tilletia indica]